MPRARKNNGHGGPRQGVPGAGYPNRTDMGAAPRKQPITAPTGLPYGEHQALENAQRAIPLPDMTGVPPAGSLPPIDAPTQRPNEPVTHGLPVGPGAGPEALHGMLPAPINDDPTTEVLQGLYQRFGTNGIRGMIEQRLAQNGGR